VITRQTTDLDPSWPFNLVGPGEPCECGCPFFTRRGDLWECESCGSLVEDPLDAILAELADGGKLDTMLAELAGMDAGAVVGTTGNVHQG